MINQEQIGKQIIKSSQLVPFKSVYKFAKSSVSVKGLANITKDSLCLGGFWLHLSRTASVSYFKAELKLTLSVCFHTNK